MRACPSVLTEADGRAELPRLGGMARPDGVVIVSERYWAFAGRDGNIREGVMPKLRHELRVARRARHPRRGLLLAVRAGRLHACARDHALARAHDGALAGRPKLARQNRARVPSPRARAPAADDARAFPRGHPPRA